MHHLSLNHCFPGKLKTGRYNILLLCLSLSFAFSCNHLDEPDAEDVYGDLSFTCTLENATSDTKVVLGNGNLPVWESGDRISVFIPDGISGPFSLVDGAGSARGTFRGSIPSSEVYFAKYPYQESDAIVGGNVLAFNQAQIQTGVADNFSGASAPMVASFSDSNQSCLFRNVFGLIELRLSGTARISRIRLTSVNTDDMLWGDFRLSLDGRQGTDKQTISSSGGSNSVTLSYDPPVQLDESPARSFYLALPPGTLAQGFTVDIYDGSDNLIYTKSTTKAQTIVRSGIRQMVEISDICPSTDDEVIAEPYTWAAYNNFARTGTADQTVIDPQTSGYPARRSDKYVGAFYFIWHTSNSVSGPYDVQAFLKAKYPSDPYSFHDDLDYSCGGGKTHHWGHPYLGYYRDDDLWVLRKHAQMLVDAGVDFIAFDVTNNVWYESEITILLDLYLQMRAEGNKTPQVTFMVWHSGPNGAVSEYDQIDHNAAVTHLYNYFYKQSKYADLWFKWEGKPLLMAIGSDVKNAAIKNYFTFRPTWYLWNTQAQTRSDVGDPWWTDGGTTDDKWPWGVCYTNDTTDPMRAGTHNGVNEFCSVAPATHPVSNIGRSYPINQGITYTSGQHSYVKQPEKGIYFKSQFNAAQALDPKIMFFTGWNEFLMGHFAPGVLEFWWCGGVQANNSMFVDQYNNEFSRDIEPIEGDFGDNYYYYMADFIRKFKGVDDTPVFSRYKSITIDGNFFDWNSVPSAYGDDKEDNKWRGYNTAGGSGAQGYGSTGTLFNTTGRNDLQVCKVATDGANLYFYVKAAANLTGFQNGNTGLNLLISTSSALGWEGFNYILCPTNAGSGVLNTCSGSGALVKQPVASGIPLCVSGQAMEVAIPLAALGISSTDNFTVDFKWVDNVDLSQPDGIQRCMRDGDSAPNGRFRYRYRFNK